MIHKCTCNHEYQDEKYGQGKRVHNEGVAKKIRCTVCGKESYRGSKEK